MKLALPIVAMLFLSACTTTDAATPTTTTTQPTLASTTTLPTGADLFPDLASEVFATPGLSNAPVVVFFHGGSWYTGDPDNVADFAAGLSAEGIVVYNATYRTGQQAGGYPQSYQDVACAIADAQATAAQYGGDPERVFVAGHSAGAHLAATAIIAGTEFSRDCAFDGGTVAGFVGLAGPYRTNDLAPLLEGWFGGTIADIPDVFAAGQPYGYIDSATAVPTLLIHGTADELVPVSFTTDLSDALAGAGWSANVEVLDQVTHGGIISLDASTTIELIAAFVRQ